jgi:hypothetical protein
MARPKKYVANAVAARKLLFKPGDHALVMFRWHDPVSPCAQCVSTLVDIVRPTRESEAECRSCIANRLQWLRILNFSKARLANRRQLISLESTAQKLIRLISELPPELRECLFSAPSDNAKTRSGVQGHHATHHYREFVVLMRMLIGHTQMQLKEKRGAGPNLTKFNCATAARDLLIKFGVKPTLTHDGQFYQLAAALYENVAGKPDVDMDKHCRKVLKNLRPDGRPSTIRSQAPD